MEWYEALILMLGLVIGLMALAVPVAFVFFTVSIIGMLIFIGGTVGIEQMAANITVSVSQFAFIPLPLFLLMGELFFNTGIAMKVFDAFDAIFGKLPGRLSYLTVAGGTAFAACSGTTLGNTAMLGSLMAPEMLRRGYKKHMTFGPILGVGGLASIIPPSGFAVLLGSLAGIDVGRLLIGGLGPGLLLAVLYSILIFVQVKIDPEGAPRYDVERVSLLIKLKLVVSYILPIGLVIFMVVGLILLGIATPSESAAFGVLGVIIIATFFRCLTWESISKSLFGALKVSVMAMLIVMASTTFSQIMAISGATAGLVEWVSGLQVSSLFILIFMFAALLIMGMFMDVFSIMMLTIPIFFPLATSLGFDPIWFGIIVLLSLEISGVTPPLGLQLFVMLGVAPKGTTYADVSKSVLPYIGCDITCFVLLIIFPQIALYLPGRL